MTLPEDKQQTAAGILHILRKRFVFGMKKYRSGLWLAFLFICLVLFTAWLPAQMRTIIWQGLAARGVVSGLLLLFSLLALSLIWSAGQRLDAGIFLFLNLRGPRYAWLDQIMLAFTQIGSGISGLLCGLILFMIGDRLGAVELILATLTLWIVVELIKAFVRRSRPFIHLTQARIVGRQMSGRSFPSGHTSQAFLMATLIAAHFQANPLIIFLIFTGALLVGITRIYVGAHYPRDVLAGAILGSVWGILGGLLDGYIRNGAG